MKTSKRGGQNLRSDGEGFLKDEHDAFGHMLWAHFRGENVFEIIERDDGYMDATDPSMYFF